MEQLLLKKCRFIVTQNNKRQILEKQDILIEDDKIARIGKLKSKRKTIDCSQLIVLPGLINLHTHTCTNLLRGISDDLKLKDWLETKVWPAEAQIKDIYPGALLTAIESIKCGTTCFVDHSFQIQRVAKAVEEVGIRAFLGYCMLDMFDEKKAKKEVDVTLKVIRKLWGHSLITPTVAVHAPNTCSKALLKKAAQISEELKLLNVIHILETKKEADFIEKHHKKSVIQYLKQLKFLNKRTLGIHLCWLGKQYQIYAKTGAAGAHCPVSNMKLASGARMPVPELLKAKARVGLGTDSNASNNNQDMFEEMKTAGLLHKYELNNATKLPVQDILDMATRNAADILGIKAGRLEPGHLADIIAIPATLAKLTPAKKQNIISHLVYAANGSDVVHTMVAGKLLMQNQKLLCINEAKALASVNKYFDKSKPF